MKWSPILHAVSAIFGVLGVLSFIGAWLAGNGTFLGFTEEHLNTDTTNLFLASIAFGVGTLIHRKEEGKK